MSHLGAFSKWSVDEVSNVLPEGHRLRRSMSLNSWVLDDFPDLYKDNSENIEADPVFDYSLTQRPKSFDESEVLQRTYSNFSEAEKRYLPNNKNFYYSEKSQRFDGTENNREINADTGYFLDDCNAIDRNWPIHWEPSKSSSTTSKQKTSVAPNPGSTKYSSNKSNGTSHSSFLGQLFSGKKLTGSVHRTRSTGNVHDENNITPSSSPKKHVGSSLFKYNRQNSSSNEQQAQVKTKIRSMWNNVKYGWRVKREVNLKVDSAIWLLGQCYHNKLNDCTLLSQDVAKQLKLDLLSKIWLTYRINFPAISGTDIVSDSGWGCMLRAGQMMMAQALVCHFLHRDWRISLEQSAMTKELHRMILRWFGDTMSEKSPFSLHHLVLLGEHYGRKPGDWYGPTHAAHVLRDALTIAKNRHSKLRNLCMYVASDGIVFKQDVFDLCLGSSNPVSPSADGRLSDREPSSLSTVEKPVLPDSSQGNTSTTANYSPMNGADSTLHNVKTTDQRNLMQTNYNPESLINRIRHVSECEEANDAEMTFLDPCPSYTEYGPPSFSTIESDWESLILFVSVRLGNDKINPFYIPCLKSLLAYENCIGIIGGRPKHALYFIGWQEDKLIHMDPHSCQPAIDVEKEDFNEKSFHSSSIRTMSFSEMDPSCAIGFYFRKKEDFELFIEKFSEITAPLKRNSDYPVFALAEGKRIEIEKMNAHLSHGNHSCSQSFSNDSCKDDDYILL